MLHPALLSVCCFTCLSLCGCSYSPDMSVTTQVDTAPIEPISVPAAKILSALDAKQADLNRAEEILGVALAQARAFSPRVLGLQESISRSVQQQFANQVLTDSRDNQFRRGETRWRPTGLYGTGQGSKHSSGTYAGDEYLSAQRKKLAAQLDDQTQRFETTLQEETWLRLSAQDQS